MRCWKGPGGQQVEHEEAVGPFNGGKMRPWLNQREYSYRINRIIPLVGPWLEYCIQIWFPQLEQDIDKLDTV